jgi:hypothetical protein
MSFGAQSGAVRADRKIHDGAKHAARRSNARAVLADRQTTEV